MDLEQMLRPRSVAIVGASQDPQKFGYKYLAALQHQGFAGRLYAVNPRAEPVLGCKGYQSLSEIPESVDYVISTVPSAAALQVVSESVEKGVRFLHFFTAQFGETGDDAKIGLERELLGLARKGGLRILGPNCMGVYHPDAGLAFWRMPREPGGVGLISQSGGLAGELVRNLSLRGVRFSKVVSFGNALDIDEIELLEFLADDPDTTIIAAYLEGTRDGSALLGALQKAATRKPVLIQKCGRTEAGAQAVASHTASLAGSHAVVGGGGEAIWGLPRGK